MRAGVTGARASMEDRVEGLIELLHSVSDKAVAVGFGVSTPAQVDRARACLSQPPCAVALLPCWISALLMDVRPSSVTAVLLVQAEKLVSWGAEGVVVGSALVKALGEAESPKEGLKAMTELARRIRAAIP